MRYPGGMFTFVTGGLRSGKSEYGLRRASETGADYDLIAEVESFADRLYRSTTPIVLVTTEIGLGFLPASVPDRRLINVAGIANQVLAERARSVVMMVSGVPLRLR